MRLLSRVLSDWEVEEMALHRRRGWKWDELARYYGVSERAVRRAYGNWERRQRVEAA